jgi:DNA-binding response OmpR family regulator
MAKILIVDDDLRILKLYCEFLSNEGFEVLTAGEAGIGFDLAVSESPDLILLDVMMPGIDGTQLHERLSKDVNTSSIRTVFLTSLVKEEEVAASEGNIGGFGYISKSTPKEEFFKRINEILSGK